MCCSGNPGKWLDIIQKHSVMTKIASFGTKRTIFYFLRTNKWSSASLNFQETLPSTSRTIPDSANVENCTYIHPNELNTRQKCALARNKSGQRLIWVINKE